MTETEARKRMSEDIRRAEETNKASLVEDAPESRPDEARCTAALGPTVWLKMDFRASRMNILITLPIVLVTVIATWSVSEVQFVVGLMVGVWIASAHNVLWGWLTRQSPSNVIRSNKRG
jgi:hypothetical protein